MLVKPGGGWCGEECDRVAKMVNRRLQGQVRISVTPVRDVTRTPAGKLLRVVNSRQIEAYSKRA
jgi:hypothetical protein